MWNTLSRFLRPRNARPINQPHPGVRLRVEAMEDRVTPSWGAVPPYTVAPPTGATEITLSSVGQASGSADISASEVDWYKLVASTTGRYTFQTDNAASGIDTVVGIYNSLGTRIGSNDDISTTNAASAISLNLISGRTYYIGATNYLNTAGGAYGWSVTGPPPDDGYEQNDTFAGARVLGTLNQTLTIDNLVKVDPIDFYRFTVGSTAGRTVSISFNNAQGNLDLAVFSNAGYLKRSSITNNDGESLLLTGLAAGTYVIKVYGRSGASNLNYSLTVSGPPATSNWYSDHLTDVGLQGLVEQLNSNDGAISRGEALQIFAEVRQDGTVSATEYADLRTIVSDTSVIHMSDDVRVLSRKIVLGNPANAHYQGTVLGNLGTGSTATRLERLVNKWFLGLDHPATSDGVYTMASGTLFGPSISYSDVRQGENGDCYYLSALGAVAFRNSALIQQMFIDNGDGTFAVRFFQGSAADYVTVDRALPTLNGRFVYANLGDLAGNASNVLWVALAEKAYAQLNEEGWLGQEAAVNSYPAIEGGAPDDALRHVSGAATTWSWTDSLSFNTIRAEFDGPSYVTFGSRSFVAGSIVPNHAYVMIGYDAAAQTVTLYNPWGLDGGVYNGTLRLGVITLNMNELRANFDAWYHS